MERPMIDSTGHAGGSPDAGPAEALLRELRRDAARIQHEINNPLAALLAEAQLLQQGMSQTSVDREIAAGADRIVELARRVVKKVRELDAVRGEESPP
jgi:signal transduction histidine kinase